HYVVTRVKNSTGLSYSPQSGLAYFPFGQRWTTVPGTLVWSTPMMPLTIHYKLGEVASESLWGYVANDGTDIRPSGSTNNTRTPHWPWRAGFSLHTRVGSIPPVASPDNDELEIA